MKKALTLLTVLLLSSSILFAGHFLGTDKNLSLDGDFAFLLLDGKRAKDAEQSKNNEANSKYKVSAIGFRVEALYDKTTWPVDVYASMTFTFPNKYTDTGKSGTQLKSVAEANNIKDYAGAKTAWNTTKIAAGALYDINLGNDTEELPLYLKVGGGLNYNSFITKDSGKSNGLKHSFTSKYQSFGLEAKGDVRYYIGSSIYAKFMLEAGFSFLGSYLEMDKTGSDFSGTRVPIQFVTGFNMAACLGLCYQI